jgi:polynucleotide 5'-kinase involved in rRNA processing
MVRSHRGCHESSVVRHGVAIAEEVAVHAPARLRFDMLRLNHSNTRMSAQVLVRHGSPGSGKTTLAEVIAERLRQANLPTR